MTAVFAKALALLLLSAALVLTIGAQKAEMGFLLSLAIGAVIILQLIFWVLPYVDTLDSAFRRTGGATIYFTVALKALGISYLTGFAADTCRDFGQTALASKAELAGKCAIFILCVSPASDLLNTVMKFAGI